jgi:hypothetical protein
VEQRAIQVSMAPPRRLMQDSRFRTFKTRDDRTLWDGLLAPVEALIDDGYQVVRVLVDWGAREPLLPRERERAARALTHCDIGVCQYGEQTSRYGRGRTELWLERS